MKIDKRHLLNYSILLPYLILSVLGLIMVYSTTSATLIQYYLSPFRSVLNQGAFWLLSLTAISLVLLQSFNTEYKSPILILWLCWYTHQNFNFSRCRKAEERSISSVLFVYASQCFYALNRSWCSTKTLIKFISTFNRSMILLN